MNNILIVIPDYGDKHGVTRKNLRILVNKPLIYYSISKAQNSSYSPDIVVSTNDIEIINICKKMKVDYIERPNRFDSDNITLDPIVYYSVAAYEKLRNKQYDTIVTLQPTSPLLSTATLDKALKASFCSEYDTFVSAINRPHLAWRECNGKFEPLFNERKNRKYLPKHLEENGTFVISKRENITPDSRFGKKIYVFEISVHEGLEILSLNDWILAESELQKKNILIRLEGYKELGMGHIYRGIQLASILFEHNVSFAISKRSKLAIDKIEELNYKCYIINDNNDVANIIDNEKIDIVVNDILDTEKTYINMLKSHGCRVINLEDLGDGIQAADIVINDLYTKQNDLPNCYWGQKYYCIKDEFLIATQKKHSDEVHEVLIMFGGTDPCNITQKALYAISKLPQEFHNIHYTIIMGAGNKNINDIKKLIPKLNINATLLKDVNVVSEYMSKADLAISSQGRTMYELAHMTVPTIVIAQNKRELCHEFGYISNGFINLGIASELDENTIRETLIWLINSPKIRAQIKKKMESFEIEKGIYRVKKLILGENR